MPALDAVASELLLPPADDPRVVELRRRFDAARQVVRLMPLEQGQLLTLLGTVVWGEGAPVIPLVRGDR